MIVVTAPASDWTPAEFFALFNPEPPKDTRYWVGKLARECFVNSGQVNGHVGEYCRHKMGVACRPGLSSSTEPEVSALRASIPNAGGRHAR